MNAGEARGSVLMVRRDETPGPNRGIQRLPGKKPICLKPAG